MLESNIEQIVLEKKVENLQNTAVKLIRELTLTEKSKKISNDVKLRNLTEINAYLL